MDNSDAKSLGVLNIEQLLTELDFLPIDFNVETKAGEGKGDCFVPRVHAWLNGPVSISSDAGARR